MVPPKPRPRKVKKKPPPAKPLTPEQEKQLQEWIKSYGRFSDD